MIEADGVARLYRSWEGVVGLHGVSFRLARGSVLGVLGGQRSGKTTLVRIMAGLTRPSRGHATIDGFDVVEGASKIREFVGYLPQRPMNPGSMTISGYLHSWAAIDGMSKAAREARVEALLAFFELTESSSDPLLDAPVALQRRLYIALALLSDPPALVLDEPLVGLTDAERDAIALKIRGLREQGKTLLVTGIRLADLQPFCTHILTLSEGRSTPAYETAVILKKVGEAHHARVFVETKAPPPAVQSAIQGVSGVLGIKEAGPAYILYVEPGSFRAAELRAALVSAGIEPRSIREASLTIGDIFRTFMAGPAG